MRSKTFATYFLIVTCLGLTHLMAVEEKSPDSCFSIEQKAVFKEKSLDFFHQLCTSLESVYALLGTDFFEPQKLCDISHLNKLKNSFNKMPAQADKCHSLYFEQNRKLNAEFATELFSNPDDQALFIKAMNDDKTTQWIIECSNIQKSFIQKLVQIIDFFIANQGHYSCENNQLLFDSMDNVKKFSLLSEELSDLKQKEIDQLNFLPKS